MSVSESAAIALKDVWKIFGDKADIALADIRATGIGKSEVLEKYNCVVGVADVSFDVQPGGNNLCDGFVWKWQINLGPARQPLA